MSHLFITRADLTSFECDDWLIPTSRRAQVERQWWSGREDALRAAGARQPEEGMGPIILPDSGPRFKPVDVPGMPRAWLGRTAAADTDVDFFVSGATEFVDQVLAHGAKEVRNRRARRLVAVPLIGAARGGGYFDAGAIVDALVPALAAKAREREVDIALVTYREEEFAAAQAARRMLAVDHELWPELSAALRNKARELAGQAVSGKLVVFFGAGIGASSGLPLWRDLLDSLMDRAGLDDLEAGALRRWSSLDQAQYIEGALWDRNGALLGKEVAALVDQRRFVNLSVSFLANLPIEGFITTNYDRLFESASAAIGQPAAVLPYAPSKQARRWLLKMHGCVDHPDDIVLTRRSYNRYAERNQALAGIVQAMLITREMLFIGFSLGDDNFLRIVDAVREAVHPGGSGSGDVRDPTATRLGTAILLEPNAVLSRHWKKELDIVSSGDPGQDVPEAARRLEIFLDYFAYLTASARHLLEKRFKDVLRDDERAVADALRSLEDASKQLDNEGLKDMIDGFLRRFSGASRGV